MCFPLLIGKCLHVDVRGGCEARVSQQLLHDLRIIVVCRQQRAIRVPERMPALYRNAPLRRSRFDVLLHDAGEPVRLFTFLLRAGEDVI